MQPQAIANSATSVHASDTEHEMTNTYIQTDGAHLSMVLRRHMLGQGNIGGEGPVSLWVTDTTGSGSCALKVAVQMTNRGCSAD